MPCRPEAKTSQTSCQGQTLQEGKEGKEMSDDLFSSEFVSVPRHGECTVGLVLNAAGYVEWPTTPAQADKLLQTYKISVWCAERVFLKDERMYMFDRWNERKDANGWLEPNAVIIRDVTDLLKVTA